MSTPLIKKAVLPVAGLGTRFLPATKAMPKEMLPIIDKPLIQYAVEEAIDAGIEDIILITGRGKTAIENHFDRAFELEKTLHGRNNVEILEAMSQAIPKSTRLISTRQGDPLGLGHAIGCARSIIGNEPFAIILADDIFLGKSSILKQMINAYNETGGNIVSVMEVPKKHTSRYGIITPNGSNGNLITIESLVEKPDPSKAPSNLAISGRYILQPEIFDYLANGEKGVGGEIQLTDAMLQLIGHQKFHGLLYDGMRFDCGSRAGWLEANIAMALERDDLRSDVTKILKKYAP